MKTVIIYRKSSQPTLDRYQVLFQPFLDSHQIAFCFWDENAKDFASALSDLAAQVRGEKVWRAIVALPVSDAPEDDWSKQCRQDNPFDFLCNAAPEPEHLESNIPLIELAQMLGGVPLIAPQYRVEMTSCEEDESDPEDSARLTVQEERNEELLARRREEWEKLHDQYSTHCVLPTSLYLFVGRVVPEIVIPTESDMEIIRRHESDSSMFWYRNSYPAKARFLTQKSNDPRNVHYSEDLFAFWMTVLTLATNEFPSGTFEAYKLYEVKAQVAQETLHQVLSDYYNRLDTIRYVANLQIQELQKDAQRVRAKDELPNYRIPIPVVYPHLSDSGLCIPSNKVGLANDCPTKAEPWWYGMVRASKKALSRLLSAIRPALDRACSATRFLAQMSEEEFVELDEYQFEEMETELGELEGEILSFTRSRTLPIHKFWKNIEDRKKETAARMRKQMPRRMAIIAGSVVLAVYFGGFVPDIIRQFRSNGAPGVVFAVAGGGTLLMALACLAFLFRGRHEVREKIKSYNGTMQGILKTIQNSAEQFSDYLSKCCAYMRGRSILQALEKKTVVALSGIRQMTDHIEHLKTYMKIIESWLNDFELSPLGSDGYAKNISFDFDIPPERNKEYLPLDAEIYVEIPSVGGSRCLAPYSFVTVFSVDRIPVFETGASSDQNGK